MREMRESDELDCKSCGACCTTSNASGDYVSVTRLDRRRLPTKYQKKLIPAPFGEDEEQALPLKRIGDRMGCVALKGTLGKDVSCDVYAQRPEFCRTFEKGSADCLTRRRQTFVVIATYKVDN